MRIAIGNDHAATALKFEIMEYVKELGHEVVAITDHESIMNAVKVEKAYKKIKILKNY